LLIIDADKIVYLNQTAAEILKSLLDGKSDEEVVTSMRKRYRVAKQDVEEDVDGLKHTIKRFAEATDVDPVTYLSNEDIKLFTGGFSAPHRMDIILTNEESDLYRRFCRKPATEEKRITFEQWKRVIEILWNIGVPHILFSGGEPTGFDHFVDLIRFAEEVGIVTGLLTNGRKLSDMHYMDTLVDAGLDHIQVTLQSQDAAVHNALAGEGTWEQSVKGLENALATPIYCVAHTTFTKKNKDDVNGLVSFLKRKGVYAFAGNALVAGNEIEGNDLVLSAEEARVLIEELSAKTEKEGISFTWYGNECIDTGSQPSGMWEYSLCIEPNGDVTPCEIEYLSFGNILEQPWPEIWKRSIQHNKTK
jgi:MoaA/NifB/PqqE/SkfB family radical SAM enzyme